MPVNETPVSAILQPLSTDEYAAPDRTEAQERAAHQAAAIGIDAAPRVGANARTYGESRRGTAAGLLALNEAAGERYFELPAEAALDDEAAVAAFSSGGAGDRRADPLDRRPADVEGIPEHGVPAATDG